jgi:hypothetical protein
MGREKGKRRRLGLAEQQKLRKPDLVDLIRQLSTRTG